MERKEAIRSAYRLTGGNNFYDGMITCSTLSGKAVCRLVWDMNQAECDAYLENALSGIPEHFSGKLLEVPVGTGILTMPLYRTLPEADITCLDYSADMMGQAQEKANRLHLKNVTFQIPLVQHCLQQLAQTGVCDAPIFDFMTQLPAPQTQHIDCTDGVVVVEGLHAFNPILTETLPQDAVLNIYASLREEYAGPDGARLIATRDVRLARRITRDWRFRGHDADFTIGLWPHVCKAEDQYIKTFKNRANLVLDTSFSCEVGIWEYYIDQLTASANAGRMADLRSRFAHFVPINAALIPQKSMLREFIGTENQ